MFKEFEDREILLAYYGGSRAYQNSNEKSDKDIIVILNDFDGAMHIADRETNCEYYVSLYDSSKINGSSGDNISSLKIFKSGVTLS